MRRSILFPLLLVGCASSDAYKVRDVHGWPVSTWDARHADVLVLQCPREAISLPGQGHTARATTPPPPVTAYYEVDGRRIRNADERERVQLAAHYCQDVQPDFDEPTRTVRIATRATKHVPQVAHIEGAALDSGATFNTPPAPRAQGAYVPPTVTNLSLSAR